MRARSLLAGGTTLTCLAELEAAAAVGGSNVITSLTTRHPINNDLPPRAAHSQFYGVNQRRRLLGSKTSALVLRGGAALEETSDDTDGSDSEEESTVDSNDETDDETDDDDESDATEEEEDEGDSTEDDDTEEDDESQEKESAETSAEESSEPVVAATPTKARRRRKIQQSADVKRQEEKNRAVVPPNALYRFWLSKGRIGHVIVAAMVITSEFVTCYLPFLASFVSWLLKATGIYDAEKAIRVAEARRAAAMRGHAVGPTKRGRFGANKKAQTARKKAADQVAVGKLRSLAGDGVAGGIGRDSRYCHLSSSFMKRHALGRYSLEIDAKAARDGLVQDVVGESVAEHGEELVLDALKGEKIDKETEEETEEEEDWVVQALSTDQIQKEEVFEAEEGLNSHVEPYVEIETGSSGENAISFGVDFTIGGSRRRPSTRDAVLKAAAESRSSVAGGRRRKLVGQRSSDRDGGGGVLGRIRAAGGDMIPARVLGAYPGDAVPIKEAGNPNGLFGLASRYGYGDWSDDSEDDNNYDDDDSDEGLTGMNSQRKSRHSSRRRRRRPASAQSVSSDKSAYLKTRRSATSTSRRRRTRSASGSRRRSVGHANAFSDAGWDDIFGSGNRNSFGGFSTSSSRQQSISRAIPAKPVQSSDDRDTNAPVTPSVLAEMRRSASSNTMVRRPMERTHEKEKERQHS